MQLFKVSHTLITASSASAKETDSSNPPSRTQHFNTTHHLLSEIQHIIPENPPYFTHSSPPWTPYHYTLWHALIARSQGLKTSEWHQIDLPGFLYEDMTRCYSSWITTGHISKENMHETLETLEYTSAGKKLAALLDGEKKWFIRLDQMSPKDSPLGGHLPSSTPQEVFQKICSSTRAYSCLFHEKEDAEAQGRQARFTLVLNKWDECMDPKGEFRVFVPPPAAAAAAATEGGLEIFKISATSQYRWPVVFSLPCNFSLEETVANVHAGAQKVLHEIITYAKQELDKEIGVLLLTHGFTFDVAIQQDGSVQLVEINPFGALSGCGACSFHWVRDARVLYGMEEEEVRFAVTVD